MLGSLLKQLFRRASTVDVAELPQGYVRLANFLEARRLDVYAEPASDLQSDISRRMAAHVIENYGVKPGMRVLDVGCGLGGTLEFFKAAGMQATGIALGEDVAICRRRGLDVLEMDLSFLDFPDSTFDLVWCRHALEHTIFPYFVLSELARITRPGGLLYVEVPSPNSVCDHESNANHYSILGKRMWHVLMQRAGFVGTDTQEIHVDLVVGPDMYWAFIRRREG
jgi:ubiquinone/menaquinone biosynthesis C-methylase UbiE